METRSSRLLGIGDRVYHRLSPSAPDGTVRHVGRTGVLVEWDDGYEDFYPDCDDALGVLQ